MVPEKLLEPLKTDGGVARATLGADGLHLVNTWNSYLHISPQGRLPIPAGYMHKTEENIRHNPQVLITLGSSSIRRQRGPGDGFWFKGRAEFITADPDTLKATYGWRRATPAGTSDAATQTW